MHRYHFSRNKSLVPLKMKELACKSWRTYTRILPKCSSTMTTHRSLEGFPKMWCCPVLFCFFFLFKITRLKKKKLPGDQNINTRPALKRTHLRTVIRFIWCYWMTLGNTAGTVNTHISEVLDTFLHSFNKIPKAEVRV